MIPYASLNQHRARYPLLRYPWVEVKESLLALAVDIAAGEPVQLAYVNPESGMECLPTLGFSALMLRPGEELRPLRRSASQVVHVVDGRGRAEVDGAALDWDVADTFAVPTHAEIKMVNASSVDAAFLFIVDDAPLQRKLGFYEMFTESEANE